MTACCVHVAAAAMQSRTCPCNRRPSPSTPLAGGACQYDLPQQLRGPAAGPAPRPAPGICQGRRGAHPVPATGQMPGPTTTVSTWECILAVGVSISMPLHSDHTSGRQQQCPVAFCGYLFAQTRIATPQRRWWNEAIRPLSWLDFAVCDPVWCPPPLPSPHIPSAAWTPSGTWACRGMQMWWPRCGRWRPWRRGWQTTQVRDEGGEGAPGGASGAGGMLSRDKRTRFEGHGVK